MNAAKKTYKKVFWIVFVIVFIVVTLIVGKIIFDSVYPALSSGYKPTLILPNLSGKAAEISNKERYGYITSDEIWSGEIRVTGDIIVTQGATLTIKPGTTVLVSANSDRENLITIPFMLKKGIYAGEKFRDQYIHQGEPYRDEENHISIWVFGTLKAIGISEKNIVITSDAETPGRYDWTGLKIFGGGIAYSKISYYRVMDIKSGVTIRNSELSNVGECTLCIHDSNNILIESNWLHDSGHEIVDILNSNPTIINNVFGPSPRFKNPGGYDAGWGGLIVGSGFPIIKNNTFEGFNDAVSFFDKESYEKLGGQVLKENTFKDNIEDVVFNPNPD